MVLYLGVTVEYLSESGKLEINVSTNMATHVHISRSTSAYLSIEDVFKSFAQTRLIDYPFIMSSTTFSAEASIQVSSKEDLAKLVGGLLVHFQTIPLSNSELNIILGRD